MTVRVFMATARWDGKLKVFTPTLGYILLIWGAFHGCLSRRLGAQEMHSFLVWLGCVGMSCDLYAR